ncbi:hypothetical protein CsSME_00036080 [Camellia sinensis var. sinensis]
MDSSVFVELSASDLRFRDVVQDSSFLRSWVNCLEIERSIEALDVCSEPLVLGLCTSDLKRLVRSVQSIQIS